MGIKIEKQPVKNSQAVISYKLKIPYNNFFTVTVSCITIN